MTGEEVAYLVCCEAIEHFDLGPEYRSAHRRGDHKTQRKIERVVMDTGYYKGRLLTCMVGHVFREFGNELEKLVGKGPGDE